MLKHKDHFHGSDLEKIEEIYHIKKEDITSFSANVNPLGISPLLRDTLAKHVDAITSYPDREYTQLRKSICAYTGANFENIIVGNGSTELISLFIQTTHPKKALILGPTYSEYEREISLEEAGAYLALVERASLKISIGVALCILSAIPVILLPIAASQQRIPLEESAAASLGIVILLLMF